ncbi:alanine--glyoxylate aminotransferase family protein [Clostridiaceae bacterium OM08-6BH]|nr:alanine--glyoxylate aminotransferase family protein [Clostridiaceae bacterium OM08-6BH]
MYKIMTPGPTQVRENVRNARSLACTNPDLDPAFYDYYKETCELISELLETKNTSYILDGEGILGLEAACASLTEPGDQVLVLDNGVYGKGFADFVTMYGGQVTFYEAPYTRALDVDDFRAYLKEHHNFKYATLVHCDTPSGVLNPVEELSRALHEYGIMTIVDSVSAMFGEPLRVDEGQIDIACGGSQKALSAPPGLTFVTVSDAAMKAMEERKTPIASFYANILVFKDYYKNLWFPYTMPISDIYGLRAALENVKADTERYDRHKKYGEMTRTAVQKMGLSLYLENGYSNTVTVIRIPEGMTAADILETMKKDHNIMIAGSFDVLTGQVIRIGHMGENANEQDVTETLQALEQTLSSLKKK